MKNQTLLFCICLMAASLVISCQKDNKQRSIEKVKVPDAVLAQIKTKGFSTRNVHAVNGGYLVEGDIFLSTKDLAKKATANKLRIAKTEQYVTNNQVSGLPRVITVLVTGLGSAFVQGTDLAIQRYNALNLRVQFQRISSGNADITIQGFYEGPSGGYITLGSSGFPTDAGDPFNLVQMNTHPDAYGSNPDVLYVGSVIQHEIGHCIGMRHTDYMDRSYSCGGDPVDEGDGGIGAVNIPGTPSGPDADSWMLACSNGGDRTFNANDIIALNYLYQ
ncbi:dual-action HEIGH metallo-peptidase [Chitinophaga niastensis]|uniref:Dual-action HEIGH metallo-peptidase n=1 Tax=Chitinophaga niastensis TaxID=536980 RepID=A0A2P8HH98_CHINA|nr:M57 family metalloprotease [Chitinophaga niastensis]PSL45595.1 dual-action HEIGH metallo-peptidase [Chitinophaga niastensis]